MAESVVQDEQTDILTLAKEREEAGMEITRRWVSMWQTSLRYFLSDQLHGYKRHKKWDWVIINYIWPSIMQEMAKLSRNFKMVVSATEPDDMEIAEAFQGFLQWQWKKGLHRHGMRIEQLRAIMDGKLYGYRISKILWEGKVRWSPKKRRWLGEVRHRLWHPAMFWASDNEYINDGDCGTVRYLELSYALSLWPDYKNELEENAVSYEQMITGGGGDTVRGQTSTSGTYPSAGTGGTDKGPSSSDTNNLLDLVLTSDRIGGMSGSTGDKRRYCKISEAYLKDYTEEHKVEDVPVDPDVLLQSGAIQQGVSGEYLTADNLPVTSEMWPNERLEWDEPPYPNGRYVIRNEDTILNPDKEDQRYPHSVWPFVVTPHYLLPHMWQGSDAITLYRRTQDHINVTVSHLVNNMKQFGDPRIAVEQDALAVPPGRTEKRFSVMRGAGAIIRLARGGLNRFQVIPPMPLGQGNVMLYQLFAQEYKNIQGLQDIAQGKKTTGQTTATEAQFLAMSSNDRIKLQNIFEEEWALQIANLVAEMDQYHYDTGRIIRIIGDDQVIGATQITDRSKEAIFDIDIEPSEGLPYDEDKRIEKYKIAYELLNQPTPNPLLPEFLRVLGISAWQKLLQRHAGWAEFIAFEQLIAGVEEGKIAPEDAVKLLVQRATERIMSRQQNRIGETNGASNRNVEG